MKDRVSILVDFTPSYGEILLGVGSIALESYEELLDNVIAREEIKKFLLEQAPRYMTLVGVSKSKDFQRILYNYTGRFVTADVLRDDNRKDKKVNILLLDFFSKSIWPILVKRYIDTIYDGVDQVRISINIKKNVYLTIYEENNPDLLFMEFKEFLLCNCVVISKATIQENGDILLELILPIPPHRKFNY